MRVNASTVPQRAELAPSARTAAPARTKAPRPVDVSSLKPKKPSRSKKSFWSRIGSFFSSVGDRLLSAGKALTTAVVSAVVGSARAVTQGLGSMVKGVAQLFSGDFAGAGKSMWKGLLHVASPAVMVTLHGVSAVQTALGVEKPGRKLTAAEVGQLKRVFGDSVDYGKIRVKEGSSGLLTAFSDRPWCMGNTIYLPKPSKDPAKRMSTLVHETVHVWQHQHAGTTYLSSSIYGQTAGDGYDYNKGIREGKRFDQLSAEHQAKFIQRAYEEGAFGSDGSVGGFYEGGIDYTAYLRDAIKQVRSGNGAA